MYAIGGLIVERVSGMPWETFIRTRIFAPLGMTESSRSCREISGKPNVAVPHADVRDTVRVVPFASTDTIAPAGSVWSSVIGHVEVDALHARQRPRRQQAAHSAGDLPRARRAADSRADGGVSGARAREAATSSVTGSAGSSQDYHGETVWMHTGSIDGMSAIIGLMPDKRVGVYVLENLDHAELRHGLMYKVFDLYHPRAGPSRDWSAT